MNSKLRSVYLVCDRRHHWTYY